MYILRFVYSGLQVKLERFFQCLLNTPIWREHPETLRFLEVSELSFMGELGEKGKEMPLEKLSGRVRIPICCSQNNTFCDILSRWKERWELFDVSAVIRYDGENKSPDSHRFSRALDHLMIRKIENRY